jgi:RNA polymerase sigma-70 factor, ECF subfamily
MEEELVEALALRAAAGRQRADLLGDLLERHRERLRRMLAMRLHPQVRPRVDPSDVIQDAYVEVQQRLDGYLEDPKLPFFLWLRRIVAQRLLKTHRFHLDARQRDARRQARPGTGRTPEVSMTALVAGLAAETTSPTQRAARAERQRVIAGLLAELGAIDREVLSMRHFEDLTNEEVARELGIGKHAASKRYVRALMRLKALADENLAP